MTALKMAAALVALLVTATPSAACIYTNEGRVICVDGSHQRAAHSVKRKKAHKRKLARVSKARTAVVRTPLPPHKPGERREAPTIAGYVEAVARRSVSLSGVVPELAAFASKVVADCGSRVISAVRNTYVAGTRTKSLHASGRAVDLAGNPGCIAKHLAGWPGGASNDYHRLRTPHYHVSFGGREHGTRFSHGVSAGKRKVRRTRWAAAR